MVNVGWRFPPLSGGTRQGYTNNDIEVFKGQELIDNLAREICQNSLDARLDGAKGPVKVTFELKHVKTKVYDVFSQYNECINGCRKYWGEEMDTKLRRFLKDAENTLEQETVPVLVASDFNTKGLGGSHSRALSSAWEALTGSDGVSVKSNQNSAGSYGIGKNAPFACSSLSMVFYNTVAENNESAFIGVARLATLLNKAGKPTQRVGKYQSNDDANEIWNPIFENDKNAFRDCFRRTKRGTDVIIVGFTQSGDWVNNVTKAVLKNFFVAIKEERLVVEIKDVNSHSVIDSTSIEKTVSDYADDPEMLLTTQLYKAFVNPDFTTRFEVLESDDVEVFIKSESSFKRTIANFRATGMLVGLYSKRIFQHYAAVVIVRGQKLGELLKDTEPPRHNRWDYKQIESSDKAKRKLARESIIKIEDTVLKHLKEQFEVVTADTMDAAGVGEFLPDDTDGLGGQGTGDDILKVKVKLGKVKTNKVQKSTVTQEAKIATGTESGGDVHNEEINPNPVPTPTPVPKPVIPRPGDEQGEEGAAAGKGTKTTTTPNVKGQRAFPVNTKLGLYKVVINPASTYEKLFVECFAVGEDGRSEVLDIVTFTHNRKQIPVSKGKAGPISVQQDVPAELFITFSKKEKMKLNIRLSQEAN